MILRRNSLCVLLFPSSRELGKSSDQREPFQQMIKFLLKFTPWLQKKEKEKCLRFDFIICLFILLFFSSDDHKELLVCINSRHFNLCLGGLFALNNAEPTFKIILVRLHFARSQLFLFFLWYNSLYMNQNADKMCSEGGTHWYWFKGGNLITNIYIHIDL